MKRVIQKYKENIYRNGLSNKGNIKHGFNSPCPVCGKHIEKKNVGKYLWINKGEKKFVDLCSNKCLEDIFNLEKTI